MASREARNLREKDAKSVGRGRGREEEVEEASRTRKETNRGKRRKNEKEKKETKKKRERERDICSKSERVSWGARRTVRIAEITMWMEQEDPSSRQRRKRTRESWKEGGERVPSYHAASIGPLIFAALRFCLALSTLHTSTADRSHKTLYQGSAENRETFVRRCPIVSAQCTTSVCLSSLPRKTVITKPSEIIKMRRSIEKPATRVFMFLSVADWMSATVDLSSKTCPVAGAKSIREEREDDVCLRNWRTSEYFW